MEDTKTLQELMKKVLADTFALYVKSLNYHWNCTGINFPMYHDFFGKLYEELQGSIDDIAEHLRTLDAFAPGSMTRFLELTEIKCELNIPTSIEMVQRLLADNTILLQTLNITFELATELKYHGLADYIVGRIDIHKKHEWMLKSILA